MTTNTVEGLAPKALLERARACLKLGEATGSRGQHPNNVYNVLSDLIDALAASPSVGVSVKPLEWQAVTDQIPKHAFAAYTPFNRWLIVCEFLSMNHIVYRFNGADFDTLDEAKAAAQADYEARILSAISPDTAGLGSMGEAVYLVYDWAWTDETGQEQYARTPETAKRLQAQGHKLTPVYTRHEPDTRPSPPIGDQNV